MMSLWAPNATFTVGPATPRPGRKQIRTLLARRVAAFKPDEPLGLGHPAYKIRITVNGDRAR